MSDDKLNEIEKNELETTSPEPEMLGADLAHQLASDGTPIVENILTPETNTFVPPTPTQKDEVQTPVIENNNSAPENLDQEIVQKNEPKVPPKEFDLEAQRDIVDQITDTYVPHPIGNSE